LSALPLEGQRLIARRVLRRQQAKEWKTPFIAIIGKEGDDWFVLWCSDSQQGVRFTSGRRLLVVSLIANFSFLVWFHCVLRLGS
jgi:hypothetical protein